MTAGIRNPHLPTGCCVPFIRAWPSGRQWTHSGHCEFSKNQKFSPEEQNELGRHMKQHDEEEVRSKKAPSPIVHPACKVADAAGGTPCGVCAPRLHPATCDCDACEFWWGNLDRDDDVEVENG